MTKRRKKYPKINEEFLSKSKYLNRHNGSISRRWTEKEEEYLMFLFNQGYSALEISKALDRTEASVKLKIKRVRKQNKDYNPYHVLEKKEINKKFLDYIQPKSVLDLYCGNNTLYDNFNVTKNDADERLDADYHMDAFKCLCKLYSMDMDYDLIDLDPFGSAYDCFDLAIKMANKGLCITLGELGQKRFRRLDYVSRYYGIYDLDSFNSDIMIKHIQMIGLRNKKNLQVFCKKDWNQISRVWFVLEDVKIQFKVASSHEEKNKKVNNLDDYLE